MIYCTFMNWTISHLTNGKITQFWRWTSLTKSIVLEMTHWYYCQRFLRGSMTSFFRQTSKIGYKLSPQSTKQQLFFHSNQEICKRFHGNGIFCSSNRLAHKFESYCNAKSNNRTIFAVEGWACQVFLPFS